MIRRRNILIASGSLLILPKIVSASDSSDCEFWVFDDTRLENAIEYMKELEDEKQDLNLDSLIKSLENMKNFEDGITYMYFLDGQMYWNNGKEQRGLSRNDAIGFAFRFKDIIDSSNLDNDDYFLNYSLNADCGRLPFERDFNIEIDLPPSEFKQGEPIILEVTPIEIKSEYIVDYDWRINDDSVKNGNNKILETVLNQEQTIVSVTATTDVQTKGEATTVITATSPVSMSASYQYQPSAPVAGEPLTFDAAESAADGTDIVTYEWDFTGDGEVDATGDLAVHTFEEGTHPVSLTVHGADGTEQTTKQVLEVANERLNIAVTTTNTHAFVNDQLSVEYSVNNYVNSENLTVQMLVETPSGVMVTGVSGAEAGSNQFTAVETLSPGSQEQIRINLVANSPGTHTVTAITDYYYEDNRESGDRISEQLSFTVDQQNRPEDVETDGSTDDTMPGFGVGSGLTALAGAGYVLRNRWTSNDAE